MGGTDHDQQVGLNKCLRKPDSKAVQIVKVGHPFLKFCDRPDRSYYVDEDGASFRLHLSSLSIIYHYDYSYRIIYLTILLLSEPDGITTPFII